MELKGYWPELHKIHFQVPALVPSICVMTHKAFCLFESQVFHLWIVSHPTFLGKSQDE